MNRKSLSKILAMLLCFAILCANLGPFRVKADPGESFAEDTFGNTAYSSEVWKTTIKDSAKPTTPYSFGTDGTTDYMKPPYAEYCGAFFNGASSVTHIKEEYWSAKPKKVTVRFKHTDGNAGWNNAGIFLYYNPDTEHFAGIQFQTSGGAIEKERLLASAGVAHSPNWGTWDKTTPYSTNNQWITIEASYDYSKFNLTNKQLVVTYKITTESLGTICTNWVATYTLPEAAIVSGKVCIAFLNDIGTSSKTLIDYVKVEREKTEAEVNAETAAAFRADHAAILSKEIKDVVFADMAAIDKALSDLNKLSAAVKTLLKDDFTKLTEMKDKAASDIPTFENDDFDDWNYSKSIWTTKYNDTGSTIEKNFDFAEESMGGTKYMTPPLLWKGNTYFGVSSFTYVKESYWPAGKLPKKASLRFKITETGTGWNSAIMHFYYDPVTNTSANLQYNVATDGLTTSFRGGGYPDSSTEGSEEKNQVKMSQGNAAVVNCGYNQWLTIEATYDYSKFNAKQRQLTINYVIKQENGSIVGNRDIIYTIPQKSYDFGRMVIAIGHDTNTSKTRIDYLKINEFYTMGQNEAAAFGASHADILAKAPASDFTPAEANKLKDAVAAYLQLEKSARDVLTENGTTALLDALVAAYAAKSGTDTSAAAEADGFTLKYKSLLLLSDKNVTLDTEPAVDAALEEFGTLSFAAQWLLKDEKAILDRHKILIRNYTKLEFEPFTEDFEAGNFDRWSLYRDDGSNLEEYNVVADPDDSENKVLKFRANGVYLVPDPKEWPSKVLMTKLSFKMRCDSMDNTFARSMLCASFVDTENWNGMLVGQQANGTIGPKPYTRYAGNVVEGGWGTSDFWPGTDWFTVEITYVLNKAYVMLLDDKGGILSTVLTMNYLNGRPAFGRQAGDFGALMHPVYIDDVYAEFAEGDWDDNIEVEEITSYYTGNTFIKPGETALISGDNVGDLVESVYIMQLPDVKGPSTVSFVANENYRHLAREGGAKATWVEANATKLDIVQKTIRSIKFIVPKTYKDGIYVVKLVPKTLGAKDKYIYLNAPAPNFTVGDEGKITTKGGKLRIIGSNLVPTGNITDVRVAIKKKSGGAPVFIPITKIEENDMYSLEAQIPDTGMTDGDYELFVHNGYGDETAWSSPVDITIGPAPKDSWPKQVFNAKDYGAKADGKANDTPALVSAFADAADHGGGIVYLPLGIYRVLHTLVIPENVELKGDGKSATIIFWDFSHRPYGELPKTLLSVTNNVEIHDLAFHGTRFKSFIVKNKSGANENIYLHDIRVQLYPFAGAPTEGNSNATGEMTSTEMTNNVRMEQVGNSFYDFYLGSRYESVSNVKLINVQNVYENISQRLIDGNVDHWVIRNMSLHDGYIPLNSMEAGIMEDCDIGMGMNGVNGNMYLARTYMHDNMGNNGELYSQDGNHYYDGVVVQFIGDMPEEMGGKPADKVTYKFADSTTAGTGTLVGLEVFVVSGQGLGQVRRIVANDRNTNTFQVDEPFVIAPNRNSMVSIHTPRSGAYFVGNTLENGQGGGSYGTLIDAVFDKTTFIRHSGQVINLHNGVNWYLSTINGELREPIWVHGDGVTSLSLMDFGHWNMYLQLGIRPYSSMGLLFKNNLSLQNSYLLINWFNAGSNGTNDFIIENNFFESGEYGIYTALTAANATFADGVLLKDNTYQTDEWYPQNFKAVLTSTLPASLNKLNDKRFIDLDFDALPSTFAPGDVNRDGKISLKDCTLIRYHLEGKSELTGEQLILADANEDGVVNLKDATWVRKKC